MGPLVPTSCHCCLRWLHFPTTTDSCCCWSSLSSQGRLRLQLLWQMLHHDSSWPNLIWREERLDESRCLEWPPACNPGVHVLQVVVSVTCTVHTMAMACDTSKWYKCSLDVYINAVQPQAIAYFLLPQPSSRCATLPLLHCAECTILF